MKKKMMIALVTTVTAVAAVLLFTGRGNGDAGSYRFVEVGRGDVEATVSATGALNAVSTVQVGTQVSGQVAEINADFNDRVKKGQLIARIDPTLQEQAVREAQNGITRAEAELDQRQFQYDQLKPLWDRRVVTETEFRTAEYSLALAKSSLTSAEASLERAERNLGYTYIHAPIDGTVIERNVDVGQTVAASLSAPQLFLIAEDLSRMQILVSVDESDIGEICEDQEVRFTVQAYPDQTYAGIVKQVRLQSSSQENVVNYTVVVEVENPDGTLLPGMTATVDFILAKAADVLTVPNAALRFRATDEMQAEVGEARKQDVAGRGADVGDSTRVRSGEAMASGRGGQRPEGAARPGEMGAEDAGIAVAQLWYVDDVGQLRIARVRTGLTDGQVTEISGPDLVDGMFVVAAVTSGSTATSSNANPFQGQQQEARRGPPPGGV